MDTQSIKAAVASLGLQLGAGKISQLETLLSELARWNRKVNLTAVRDPNEMIAAHLLDSLAARPLLKGQRILDVGTGAGFPGLPLAITEPDREFHLVDSNNKKVMFVQHAARALALANVIASKARTEDYAPGQRFDTVIARAVASLPRLLEIAGHHVGEDGVFVALKGRHPAEELQSVPPEWGYDVIEMHVPGLEKGSRHAVLMRRRGTNQ
ncbi:MAG TPA: 16S rRNA (guanine(527)-N(7))-methyltransferase RsmG [Woeseiaceae bacterium]|nr:16S rRNA (guanine(527)-N(7))-methyltransferase RsmG [Woeseiaceae bacterium]